jgi:hypothetical protein
MPVPCNMIANDPQSTRLLKNSGQVEETAA